MRQKATGVADQHPSAFAEALERLLDVLPEQHGIVAGKESAPRPGPLGGSDEGRDRLPDEFGLGPAGGRRQAFEGLLQIIRKVDRRLDHAIYGTSGGTGRPRRALRAATRAPLRRRWRW